MTRQDAELNSGEIIEEDHAFVIDLPIESPVHHAVGATSGSL